jgi:hypothetical protein
MHRYGTLRRTRAAGLDRVYDSVVPFPRARDTHTRRVRKGWSDVACVRCC